MNHTTTSLCPILGETYAKPINGMCPDHFQIPHGKIIKVSFIGVRPHIIYEPIGGSDFLVMNILANKFRFKPEFIPEKAYDMVEHNGTSFGMLHRVRHLRKIL